MGKAMDGTCFSAQIAAPPQFDLSLGNLNLSQATSAVPGELRFRLVAGYLSVVRRVFQVFEVVLDRFSIQNCTSLDLLFAFSRRWRGHRNVAHVFTLHRSPTSFVQFQLTRL